MAEVFRAMKSLNFQWKVVNPYHARCRVWNQVSGSMIKMSLQLYKADDKNYLLDFKNLPDRTIKLNVEDEDNDDTHTLEFFELCAMLISELGH
jgi:5'-AMP-activated protein kinase catalytic alpha subunit